MLKTSCLLVSLTLLFVGEINAQAAPKAYPKNTIAKPDVKVKQPVKQTSTVKTTGYTAAEQKAFITECIKSSKMGEEKGSKYCTCMLGKLMKLYPDIQELNKQLTDSKINELAKECLPPPSEPVSKWTSTDRTKFTKECQEKATEKIGQAKAKTYCSCMLAKIETAYPDPAGVEELTAEQITKWAAECNKQ